MKIYDNPENNDVVQLVVDEMIMAEKNLLDFNASWYENYESFSVPSELWDNTSIMANLCEKDRLFIEWYKVKDEYQGPPIKKITLDDKYPIDVSAIRWDSITKKSLRVLRFYNNGQIVCSKHRKTGGSKGNKKGIEYFSYFNVSSNDFILNVDVTDYKEEASDEIHLILNGDSLIKSFNAVVLTEDLQTRNKNVWINKDCKNNSQSKHTPLILFEASLNSDNQLKKGSLTIKTRKGNGKVNGTYRITLDEEHNVTANFYSRKGVNIDLISNPLLLEQLFTFINNSVSTNKLDDNLLISDFSNCVKTALANQVSDNPVVLDSSNFYMPAIAKIDTEVLNYAKLVHSEMPLEGLKTRLGSCIKTMDKSKNSNKVLCLKGVTSTQK